MSARLRNLVWLGFSLPLLAGCGGGAPAGPGDAPGSEPPPETGAAPADTVPPVLESAGFGPRRVTVTTEGALVHVSARIRDPGSGVARVQAHFREPQVATYTGIADLFLARGDARDGRFEGVFFVPRGAPSGDWTFFFLQASDGANNTATWTTRELEEMGIPVTLEVDAGG